MIERIGFGTTAATAPPPLAGGLFQAHIAGVSQLPFIPPSEPVEQSSPPSGKGWLHEVKFDGYRLQLHKLGETGYPASERNQRLSAVIWSKNGKDFTARFRDLARAVAELPCKSCIIDAEGVAPDAQGNPDFRALVGGQQHKMGVCFDLLEIDGRDLRPFPLVTRRVRLAALLRKAQSDVLIFSDAFPDPLRLLADLDARGLEGIVSKKADQPYVSGKNRGWVKVKCHAWRAANAWRGEVFNQRRK